MRWKLGLGERAQRAGLVIIDTNALSANPPARHTFRAPAEQLRSGTPWQKLYDNTKAHTSAIIKDLTRLQLDDRFALIHGQRDEIHHRWVELDDELQCERDHQYRSLKKLEQAVLERAVQARELPRVTAPAIDRAVWQQIDIGERKRLAPWKNGRCAAPSQFDRRLVCTTFAASRDTSVHVISRDQAVRYLVPAVGDVVPLAYETSIGWEAGDNGYLLRLPAQHFYRLLPQPKRQTSHNGHRNESEFSAQSARYSRRR